MYVAIYLSNTVPVVRLAEPYDLESLKVVAWDSADPVTVEEALGPRGTMDDDGAHVWLEIDALMALAGPIAGDPAWLQSFNEMVTYAGSKGWMSPTGSAIRAHVDRI
jgi:hypothetical protein